jgi:hypothetical protein
MTNAGFVSQLVVPGAGAMAGRSEQPGGRTDEGEFSDLLSKFADGKEQILIGDRSVEGDDQRPQGERPLRERQRVPNWLAGGAETWQPDRTIDIGATEITPPITPPPPDTVVSIEPVVAQAMNLVPVTEQTGEEPKSAVPLRAGASVPLPVDVASEQPAMPTDEAIEPQPALEVTADITVLKRETHIAPGSAARDSLVEWAASMLGAGKGRVGGGAAPQSGSPAVEPDVGLSTGLPSDEKRQGVLPVAITPSRPAQAGTGMKQAASPVPVPAGAASEALPEAAETEPIAMRVAPSGSGEQVPTPVQVIAGRILQEASGTAPATATTAPAMSPQHALMTPAKVLHIQLQPAELGIVTLRMSLKDQTLRLEVEVGNAETGRMIQNDKDALSTLLRSAGYLVDGLDVRIVDPANTGTQTGSGQSTTQMQGGGQSQADARSSDSHPREGAPRHHTGDKGRNTHDQAVEADRRGGIFV